MSGGAHIDHVQALMRRYGIAAFDYREGNTQVSLRIDRRIPEDKIPASASRADESVLRAPSFGTFRLVHPATPDIPSEFPSRVTRDTIVGYLAVGALLRPVLTEADCVLLRPLAEEGAEVGYGDPLFAIRQSR